MTYRWQPHGLHVLYDQHAREDLFPVSGKVEIRSARTLGGGDPGVTSLTLGKQPRDRTRVEAISGRIRNQDLCLLLC
jgi:hypothetical protein